MFKKFLLLLTLSGVAGNTSADVLFLINGDRITGQIVDMGGTSVTIKPAYSDKFDVKLSDIETLEADVATEIKGADGTAGESQFTGKSEAGEAMLALERAVDVTLAEIKQFEEKPNLKN